MALQKQIVSIPMRGQEQGASPHVPPEGVLSLVKNGYFARTGEIRKREAFVSKVKTVVSGGTAMSAPRKVASYGDELIHITEDRLYSWAPSATQWRDCGLTRTVVPATGTVIDNLYEQYSGDVAYSSGYACFVWHDSRTGVRYSIQDTTTGKYIIADAPVTSAATYSNPRVCRANPGLFVIYTYDSAASAIYAHLISSVTTTPTAVLVTTAVSTAGNYDVIPDRSSTGGTTYVHHLVAWVNDGGASAVSFIRWHTGNSVAVGGILSTAASDYGSRWVNWMECPFTGNIYCASEGAAGAVYHTMAVTSATTWSFTSTTAIYAGNAADTTGIGYHDGTNSTVLISRTPTGGARERVLRYRNNVLTPSAPYIGLLIYSKLVQYGSSYYFVAAWGAYNTSTGLAGSTQKTFFLLEESTGRVVAKFLPGSAGGFLQTNMPTGWADVSTTKFMTTLTRTTEIEATNGTFRSLRGLNYASIDFADGTLGPPVEANGVLMLPGGVVQTYDRSFVGECGIHLYPEPPTLTPGGAGSMTANKAYGYAIVFAWQDNQGRLHRSAPTFANVTAATMGANTSMSVKVSTLFPTTMTTPGLPTSGSGRTLIEIEIYRTEGDGSTYYKHPITTPTASKIFNDPTTDYYTFSDTLADSSINTGEILYTTGGVLENEPPPALLSMVVFKNRVWGISAEDPRRLVHSKELVPGEGVSFPSAFNVLIDDGDAGCTGLAVMDDRLIVFKRNGIYLISGEGPNNTGQGLYDLPAKVASNVGTTVAASIQLTPDGLLFQSARGVYLLTRGLEAVYAGSQIQDYATTIVGGCNVDSRRQVMLFVGAGRSDVLSDSRARALVYDYHNRSPVDPRIGTWTINEFFQDDLGDHQIIHGCSWQNQPVFVTTTDSGITSGSVCVESAGTYVDTDLADSPATFRIDLTIKTNWLSFAGLDGLKRIYEVRMLGRWVGYSDVLRMNFYYDHTTEQSEAHSDSLNKNTFHDDQQNFRMAVRPAHQKCGAIMVEYVDEGSRSTPTAGAYISAISFLVGAKPGGFGRQGMTDANGISKYVT